MRQYTQTYPEETFNVVGFPKSPMVECVFTLDTGLKLDCQSCGHKWDGWVNHDYERITVQGPDTCPLCHTPLEPIEYGGIFDTLVEFSQEIFVLEHKTTSVFGDRFYDQFKPNNQISGYCWAAGQLSGRHVSGAMINVIAVYKAQATKFDRRLTSRSPMELAEWLTNIRAVCQQIKDSELRGVWPMHTNSCSIYGGCEYLRVHELVTETERRMMLEQEYVKEPWSHEARLGVKDTD